MPTIDDLTVQSDNLRARYEEILRLRAELERLQARLDTTSPARRNFHRESGMILDILTILIFAFWPPFSLLDVFGETPRRALSAPQDKKNKARECS
jgi:hypothetical protein